MKWQEKVAPGLINTCPVVVEGREYTVRIYSDRIAVQSKISDAISWEDLQCVKNAIIGNVYCVEVFPATQSEVVNLRNTRHLWFGPEVDKLQSVLTHLEFQK